MTVQSGYRHNAGLWATNELHVGHDTTAFCYNDIASAVLAAAANDTIVLHPGTYTLTSQVLINKPLRFIGVGGSGPNGVVVTSSGTSGSMFSIELIQMLETGQLYFENIRFIQGVDDQDVFVVDNSALDEALNITFQNCDVLAYDSASTGKALNISHSGSSNYITVTMGSCRGNQTSCINMAVTHASDLIKLVGMECLADGNTAAVITDATDIAAGIEFRSCLLVETKASDGGHATQTVKSYYSYTASDYAVTTDFIGSHTETIIGQEDTDT